MGVLRGGASETQPVAPVTQGPWEEGGNPGVNVADGVRETLQRPPKADGTVP